MSSRCSLDCQSIKACIVIRKNCEISIDKIKKYCEYYFSQYAFIEHKRDIAPDTGLVEGCHYHIVGDFKTTRTRFSTRLNDIVQWFGFEDSVGVQIERYNNLAASMQYLLHKNQPDKTTHNVDEIVHNFEKGEFDLLMSSETGDVISVDRVIQECELAKNIVDVIRALGITNYKNYRNVIWDIWQVVKDKKKDAY